MTWGEDCSFSENELSGAGELCCPSPMMKRSRRDCFQTWSGHVCRRGVNITGVLLIFASRKSLCWGCVLYGNYSTTWCLSPRQFVLWHTAITHMLFAFMRFKGVISYIFIWLYLFLFPPQVHLYRHQNKSLTLFMTLRGHIKGNQIFLDLKVFLRVWSTIKTYNNCFKTSTSVQNYHLLKLTCKNS